MTAAPTGLSLGELETSLIPRPFSLAANEFETIATLAREQCGLELGPGKESLVAARVGKLARRLGFAQFRDYYRYVQHDQTGEALIELIDVLTTNHTGFFREREHFHFLVRRVFPEWSGAGSMRIWSAACSTGEEPYTIALTAREHKGVECRDLPRILASDVSTRALETARKGTYKAERFDGGTAPWLRKHLLRGEGPSQGWYRMRPEILSMVEFRRINLIHAFPEVGTFAVIFCRNVMIYFRRSVQEQLVKRLEACLQPGGYLFIGHSESLTGIQHGLQYVQPAIYRKRV